MTIPTEIILSKTMLKNMLKNMLKTTLKKGEEDFLKKVG